MILIIDNYDSFTYNLFQAFREATGEVRVVRHDAITIEDISYMDPSLIVLSPGPGAPSEAGICADVVAAFAGTIPLFGVCLGHQVIVEHFGGRVERMEEPMHGKSSRIESDQRTIFAPLPPVFSVTRYHSLHTPQKYLPPALEVSAVSEDGVVMGVRHVELPVEAVQFHPEAIRTEQGEKMLLEVYRQARAWRGGAENVYGVPV